jgi:hypothetical protein
VSEGGQEEGMRGSGGGQIKYGATRIILTIGIRRQRRREIF